MVDQPSVRQPFGTGGIEVVMQDSRIRELNAIYRGILHPSRWIKTLLGMTLVITVLSIIILYYLNPPWVHRASVSDVNRRLPSSWRVIGTGILVGAVFAIGGYFVTLRDEKEYGSLLKKAILEVPKPGSQIPSMSPLRPTAQQGNRYGDRRASVSDNDSENE